MLLSELFEGVSFLYDSKLPFDSITVNESVHSKILSKLIDSDAFKMYPRYASSSLPEYSKTTEDPKNKEWLKKIGKSSALSLFTALSRNIKLSLDQISDNDFEAVDKSEARKKKYKDTLMFWIGADGQLIAISYLNQVIFMTEKRKVFDGTVTKVGDDATFYNDAFGSAIKRTNVSLSQVHVTTLDLQRNPEIEKCYSISQENLRKLRADNKIDQRYDNSRTDFSDDEIRQQNIMRYQAKIGDSYLENKMKKLLKEQENRIEKVKSFLTSKKSFIKNKLADLQKGAAYARNDLMQFVALVSLYKDYMDKENSLYRFLTDSTYGTYNKSDKNSVASALESLSNSAETFAAKIVR